MKIWPLMLFCTIVVIGGCKPPIARNIQCAHWRNCGDAYEKFNRVLQTRFPVGSSQIKLEQELMAQGFERIEMPEKCTKRESEPPIATPAIQCPDWDSSWNPRNQLVHRTGLLICGRELGVRWSSNKAGNLTHIEGFYSVDCL